MKLKQWFEFFALLLFDGREAHKYLQETQNHKIEEYIETDHSKPSKSP